MSAKVLDIRTPAEVEEGHIEGALFADFLADDFAEQVSKFDKTADYTLHCRSGGRVDKAIPVMRELGFTGELTNVGGLDDAAAITGLPIQY